MAQTKNNEQRSRTWAFILYPESAPDNWQEILSTECIPALVSPLHDKDFNADGEVKKEHFHILLNFKGNKSFSQISEISKKLNGSLPQIVQNFKGYARYLTHLDNPEKAQYSAGDILCFAGADYADALLPTATQRHAILKEMCTFVHENNVTEYIELILFAINERPNDWFPILADSATFFMSTVVKSNRFANRSDD